MTTTINQKVASPFDNVVTAETNPVTGGIEKLTAGSAAIGLSQRYAAITAIPGVVAFWDFSEARAPFYSKAGRGLFPLRQGTSSRAAKTANGPLGHALSFNGIGDYLVLDATSVGDLNIGGRGINQCCVMAFVARSNSINASFIAGCWNEDNNDPKRQYGLFIDLPTYGGTDKICFHVSKTGAPSPNLPYSRDYSANRSAEPGLDWVCVAGSYDGTHARSYIEGRFEPYSGYTEPGAPNGEGLTYDKNPYAFSLGLNNADCEFTVGACKLTAGYQNFLSGELAALLVLERAPTDAEIVQIQNAINPAAYGFKNRLFQWSTTNSAPSTLTGCGAYRPSADDSNTLSSWQRTTTGTPSQGFVYRPSSSTGISMFTCESVPPGITTENLASVSFQMANASTADTVRLAVKIDSAWYVTDTTYAVSAASSTGADWTAAETKMIAFSKDAALWRDLTFVPGGSLSAAGAARGANLPSGTIAGWGIYSPRQPAGNVRIRNVELTTI